MLRERDRLLQMEMMAIDSVVIVCAFVASYYLRRVSLPAILPGIEWRRMLLLRYYVWIPLLAVPLWLLNCSYFGGTRWLDHGKHRRILLSILKPLIVCGIAMALVNLAFKPHTVSRMMLAIFSALCFGAFYAARRTAIWLVASERRTIRNLLVVGGAESAEEMALRLREHAEGVFRIVGLATRTRLANRELSGVAVLGTIAELQDVIDKNVIDDVIFADPLSDMEETEEAIRTCEEVGIDVHLQADFFNVLLSKTYVEQVDGLPFLTYSSAPRLAGPLLIKRLMDLAISAVLLLLLSPFFASIAILIKATSRGGILFRQRRAGLNGREFTMYKFRSMYSDAEQQITQVASLKTSDGPSFKAKDDPRVTKVGRFLRKHSLDELPQLWNVLKGDMSIVGPRPVPMHEVAEYERWQRRRLSMKPGMTCLWQVSGRSDLAFSQWMRLDLRYIDQWSLWLDLKILLLTIPAVLRGKGSY